MPRKAVIYGIIGAVIAAGIVAGGVSAPGDQAYIWPVEPETGEENAAPGGGGNSAEPSGIRTVDVGVLIPATGDLASYGIDTQYGLDIALEQFNEHLQDGGADWRMNFVVEDTRTDPITALEKTQSLDAKGIKYVLGPSSSSEIRNIMAYVNSSNMLLISPSSTSPKLAIPNDNIFRFVPDDRKQGAVVTALLEAKGIRAIATVYRGDIWGDGLYETTKAAFEKRGGTVVDGIRYSPDTTVFSTEMHALSGLVDRMIEGHGPDKVGVLILSFDEASHMFNSAIEYDNLQDVPWIGSEGVTGAHTITEDERAAKFAEGVGLMALQFSASDNEVFENVRDEFERQSGSTPNNNYVYASYDSVWALGLAMEEAGFDVQDIIAELPAAIEGRTGALGDVALNEAGDLDATDYEFLTVADGQWMPAARYNAATGEITGYFG